jgi:hypothetical protein
MPEERFERGDGPQHGRRDYAAFDRVLDIVRNAFLSIHGGFADEERWRWDAPVISFTWNNGQQINRNLNGHALGGVRPTGIEIEANGWRDVRERGHLVRYWRHFAAGRVEASALADEAVAALVEKAYTEVSSWTVESLEKREVLGHRETLQT